MGLRDHDLEAIAQDKDDIAEKCLTEVVVQWFRNRSPVTWKKVVILAAAKSGGNAPKKATTIARDYKGMGVGGERGRLTSRVAIYDMYVFPCHCIDASIGLQQVEILAFN